MTQKEILLAIFYAPTKYCNESIILFFFQLLMYIADSDMTWQSVNLPRAYVNEIYI